LRKFVLYLLLLTAGSSYGQQMTITGNVMDTNTQVPVRNAVAITIRVKDSVLLGFQRTDKFGAFNFSMPVDTVQLIVRHPDYNDFNSYIFGSADNNTFELNPLPMPEKSTSLNEFVIYANRNPIYYRGDTLIYVADSFKVKENAVVEDLLKKLPGIKVDADGKITSQGQEIGQVLVDGDEFFGSDPTIATKNLAAKGVESVKVYEKDSEDGSDTKIQVLDLTLKDEAKKGYFGKISGGTDFSKFYEGEFLLNRYNSKQKIAVFGLGSNTPKSNFNQSDMFKFGLSGGREWNENDDNEYSGGEGSINTDNGIPQTFRTGFYLDQKAWKGAKFRLNYTYADNKIKTTGQSRSQYFLTDTSYTTDEVANSLERYQSHQIGLKFTQQLDSLTRIEFEPKVTLNASSESSLSETKYLSADNSQIRTTSIQNTTSATGTDVNATLRFFRDFKKKNRKLTARYNMASSQNSSDGFLNSLDRDAQTFGINQSYDQKKENRSGSLGHTAYINYVEPIAKLKKWKTEFDYEFFMNNSDQRKTTFNPMNGEYVDVDSTFSNQFETSRQQHRAGAFLIFENAKSRISVGTRARSIAIDNNNTFTDTLIRQGLNNLLPRVVITHRFSQSNRLRFQYNTSSSLPTVTQLQPVLDNSNPNFVRVGNADLKPNYSHTLNLNYNMWKGLSGFYVYSGLNYTYQKNAFSTSVTYDAQNRTLSQAVNADRADYLYFYGGSGMPIPKLKNTRLEVNVNGNYTSTENFIQLQRNESRNTGLGTDLELSYNGDSLNLSIGGGYDYNMPSNTLSSASSKPYSSYNLTANVDWTLPFQLFLKSDATYTVNSNRTAGYGVNYVIWNASLQRSFLKTQNLYIGIEAYDLLNQNVSAYRTVTQNVITDSITNVITRYFLAKVTLKFNNNHTKEVEDERW